MPLGAPETREAGAATRAVETTHHTLQGTTAAPASPMTPAAPPMRDGRESVEQVMRSLRQVGMTTARMGAYKPRTSPYDFQGLERECLPYVFELAGKYGIGVLSIASTSTEGLMATGALIGLVARYHSIGQFTAERPCSLR